jgi:hypothetical protein
MAPSLELGQESALTRMDSKVAKFKRLTFGSHFVNHFCGQISRKSESGPGELPRRRMTPRATIPVIN